ncbi:MAG: homogentisate 1,2-dioxygenase [Thermoplasmataceae archaeon]
MVYYVRQGEMPESRHTYEKREKLLREELFGEESFEGPFSLLYHTGEPTRVASVSRSEKKQIVSGTEEYKHRHIESEKCERSGDFIDSRTYLLYNSRMSMGILKPESRTQRLFRSALHDQLFYIHSGIATLHSMLGSLDVLKGDYLYIPKGTTYRLDSSSDFESFFIESRDMISMPTRYLNGYGQLKEGAPYYDRDIRVPKIEKPSSDRGNFEVWVDYGDHYLVEKRDTSPFDVVGWDGYLYPYAINVSQISPIVGKLHQPPPVHETFSGKSFMIGTFLPRKFDFHPRAIPISYYHSNIDTDEVLFYSTGNFMSRTGINPGSITLHVRGLIHGPQPGSIEKAIGVESTDEVAVMVEAYDPLQLTADAENIEDKEYMKSWYK